jgi:hypothetical protein
VAASRLWAGLVVLLDFNAIASNWSENALAVYSANVAAQTNFAGMGFFNQDADSPIGQVADIYTNPTGTLSLTASGNPAIQLKYGSFGISGGTPALTVDNAGRIGIGTTSPDSESLLDLGSGEKLWLHSQTACYKHRQFTCGFRCAK